MRRDRSGWALRSDADLAARWRAQGHWRDRTIAGDAVRWAALHPDRICLRDGTRAATFAQAVEEARRLAAGLRRLGLQPGQVLSFQLPNWIEAAVVNLAAAFLGAVVNPIVPIYRDKEMAEILRDCRARILLVPQTWRGFDHAAMAARLRAALPDLEHVVVVRHVGAPEEGAHAYEGLLIEPPAAPGWPDQDPDAVKFVMYTSGTTGRAKGVLHTHNTLGSALTGCMRFWKITETEPILMPSPVSHMTGYLWGLEAPFVWGNETILMDRWEASEAVRIIDACGVALTVSATPFLKDLLDAAEPAGSRLPSLRIFGCGGASVPPELIRRANGYFANGRAFRVYGTSEAVMIGRGFVGPGTLDLAADTDGKIVDFDVRFVDDDDRPVPEGSEGEILARGPARFVGYVDEAETARCIDGEGYFHTGDLGCRTVSGAIVITGRKKDLINRGGEKLSAREIEELLERHPAVREIAAVAMPHPRLGETTCVFVIPRGTPPALEDLTTMLERSGIARQKLPERLEIVDDFPRTPAGKVKKDILRAIIATKVRAQR